MAGDIALVRSPGLLARVNVGVQRGLRGRATYSHALINVNGFLWCHAVPQGIELLTTGEVFCEGRFDSSYAILRKRCRNISKLEAGGLESSANDYRHTWLGAALFHFGQKYNYRVFLPKRKYEGSAFCSELVVAVYERMRDPIVSSAPEQTLPADLERLAELDCWEAATESYRVYLARRCQASGARELQWKVRLLNEYRDRWTVAKVHITNMRGHVETLRIANRLGRVEVGKKIQELEREVSRLRGLVWTLDPTVDKTLKWLRRQKRLAAREAEMRLRDDRRRKGPLVGELQGNRR